MRTAKYRNVVTVEILVGEENLGQVYKPAEDILTVTVAEGGFCEVGPVEYLSGDQGRFILYVPPTRMFRLREAKGGQPITKVD